MPAREELAALLEKYDLLLKLHAGEPGRTVARRDTLRNVAARFPSALREWEALSTAELFRRKNYIAELLAAASFELASAEPWLIYTLELHTGLRALLAAQSGRRAELGRRVSAQVYEEIAARHGVSVAAVKQAIFTK